MAESSIAHLTINGRTRKVKPTTETEITRIRDRSGTDYLIFCLSETLTTKNKRDLIAAGVRDIQYIGQDVYYLGEYASNDLSAVQALQFVVGVDVYRRDFKVTGLLEQHISDAAKNGEEVDVQIALHSMRSKSLGDTVEEVAETCGIPAGRIEVDEEGSMMTIRSISPTNVGGLSAIDAIRTIQPVVLRHVANDRARVILGLDSVNFELPYKGKGQVIAIADTGLDLGDAENVHPAFKGRVRKLIPIGRSQGCDDPNGHGTHVSGSALGAPVSNRPGFERVQGVAPEAELVMQSLLASDGSLSSFTGQPLYDLFAKPHLEDGACIHSNSWGDAVFNGQQPYTALEHAMIDKVVWDNPSLLIIMSAGNYGQRSRGAQITGTAACKNVLTVGAAESSRPSVQGLPVLSKVCDNDITEVGFFSSRGPTFEQRIKPEVLAPGTAILSARTRRLKNLSPGYVESGDELFCYTYGTSMAAPQVAGSAAVVRQYLAESGVLDPPAALIKAILINGAYSFHHAHSASEGFGLVNVANSLISPDDPESGSFRMEHPGFDDTKQSREYVVTVKTQSEVIHSQQTNPESSNRASTLRVTPPSRPGLTLKATLVYNDPPGEALQNKLTLSITASDRSFRYGNRGSSNSIDRYNNVEQIIWKGITPGPATITVLCNRLTTGPQPFAVVWRFIPSTE